MTETTKIAVHESFDLITITRLLIRKKKIVLLTTLVVSIIAIIISFGLSESYKSTCTILPETDKSKLSVLGGFSDLASMAGMASGDASPVRLYPAILKSESLLKPIILNKYKTKKFNDSVNLIQYWEIKANTRELVYETALNLLRNELDVTLEQKTNIITLSLETNERQLTADILNCVAFELDKYMRTKRTTNATKQRQWIEARLFEVKQDLSATENRIKDFRERNRSVTGSPLLLLEQDRLLRDIQINATLYTELKKQFELIKIEEIKNVPIINVMDAAIPAAKKSRPKRSIIVITSFLLALVGSSVYVSMESLFRKKISAFLYAVRN